MPRLVVGVRPLVLPVAAAYLTLAVGQDEAMLGASLPEDTIFEASTPVDRGSPVDGEVRKDTRQASTTTRMRGPTTTTATTTSTTGARVFGGNLTKDAFAGWLSVWRSKYEIGVWKAELPDPWESLLPKALRGHDCKVVESKGGAAGGIVTEGMGYGIMIEGFLAAKGEDPRALNNSLGLIKSWMAMVNGGVAEGTIQQPLGGGRNVTRSSTYVETWPYGVSAIEWSHMKLSPAGVAAWKFPINQENILDNMGSATDGDQDAILGMVYTAHALGFPADFVDVTVRSVIAFASADLGFPDLYRVLPGGGKVFVPKMGSMWGGLTPDKGRYKTKQQPWCYSPGYFAPAHYRTMRDFLVRHWKRDFDDYLPIHLNRVRTTLAELIEAFNSAITTGYNILYYSSCSSGSVSNWVGVKSPCSADDQLNCPGVPWEHTPWVGPHGGNCSQSGTKFGSFGADASRSAWRIAMDYVLYREESAEVSMYDRQGYRKADVQFGSRRFLNRIVGQYSSRSICDGGLPGDCMRNTTSPFRVAYAFDVAKYHATDVVCPAVPNPPMSWWAGFMAYPTFTAFVAPYDEIGAEQMTNWMDTFSSICNFSMVDKWDYSRGHKPKGGICLDTYFEASQAVIATMIMADTLRPIFEGRSVAESLVTILKDAEVQQQNERESGVRSQDSPSAPPGAAVAPGALIIARVFKATAFFICVVAALAFVAAVARRRGCKTQEYLELGRTMAVPVPSRQLSFPEQRTLSWVHYGDEGL